MRALDLFAGVGWGVACKRLGIAEAGIEKMKEAKASRAAADMVTIADDVWKFNLPNVFFNGHIASPPCQTFSAAGKGAGRKALDDVLAGIDSRAYKSLRELQSLGEKVGDERTALVLTPLHFAYEGRPQWIAWEQVPTVLPVWEACADELRELGYSVWTGNLQAEQYGVSQTRKRAFLLAHLDREVNPPVPTHSRYYPRSPEKLDEGVQKWVSMAEALGGTETGGAEPIAKLARYTSRQDWAYRNNPMPNQALRSLDQPAPTVAFGHERPEWVRREALPQWAYNRPSTTIVGTFKPEIVAAPGYRTTVSRQNAPDSVRVTVAEAGVLQSFDADFPWQGSKSKQYLQVGNAVPPLLAEHVLRAVTGLE